MKTQNAVSSNRSKENGTIQVGNAPVSWGVIENVEGERGGYRRVLDEIAETGYAGTELGDWGFLPTDPDLLRAELESRNLELIASWVGIAYADPECHADGATRAVQTAKLLAEVGGPDTLIVLGDDHSTVPMRTMNAGRIRPDQSLSEAGWQIYAQGVNRVARAVQDETGLRCVFHHHAASWVETPWETDRLLSMTDPTIVGLVFDTGHYQFGGGDAVEGLKDYVDRVWHVHFKDHDPAVHAAALDKDWGYPEAVGQGVFCELGQGDVDFPGVLNQLDKTGYRGWIVVEQDVLPGTGRPKESARRSRQYLRGLGL